LHYWKEQCTEKAKRWLLQETHFVLPVKIPENLCLQFQKHLMKGALCRFYVQDIRAVAELIDIKLQGIAP